MACVLQKAAETVAAAAVQEALSAGITVATPAEAELAALLAKRNGVSAGR